MPHAVGPILRILGLLVELFGLAVLTLSGRNDGADLGAQLGIAANTIWAIVPRRLRTLGDRDRPDLPEPKRPGARSRRGARPRPELIQASPAGGRGRVRTRADPVPWEISVGTAATIDDEALAGSPGAVTQVLGGIPS